MENFELLQECKLQLEYLNEKFGETGTTNSLLSKLNQALHKPVVSGKRLIDIVEQEIKYAPTIAMKNHLQRILEAASASGEVDKTVSVGVCECSISTTQGQCMGLVNCRHYHPSA